MSFFEQKYNVTSHNGSVHSLTAKQLYERILKDCKSDYNWIAPARELVRICKKSSFPTEYAIDIKIAILNCFANIEHRGNCGADRYIVNPEDKEAIQYSYNSLYNIDSEEARTARKKFLTEMIMSASYVHTFDPLHHPGPTFIKIREDWCKSKLEEYISKENINFKQLVEILRSDFTKIIKTAESNGDFEEDEKEAEKKYMEICRYFHESLKDT